MPSVTNFNGEFSFLSNFAPSPFALGTQIWPTVEHAFQAKKTWNQRDRQKIQKATTPGKAKRLGRTIEIRDDWEFEKTHIMLKLVRKKFEQNPDLANLLINTGGGWIAEGNNWHDNFWGVCGCPKCDNIPAENMLGRILMLVREELRP